MTPAIPHTSDVVEGRVSRVNDHGVLLEGEDVWINLSRYAQPRPKLPKPGEAVRLFLDGQGYIRDCAVLHDVERAAYEPDGVDAPPPEEPSRQVDQIQPMGSSSTPPDRDLGICRQAVLNTATAILSSGARAAEPDAVLALAERLERWVGR